LILGLETSCDETAAAVITRDGQILANVISSQADLHARYGGVVPEVASRRHLELVTPVVVLNAVFHWLPEKTGPLLSYLKSTAQIDFPVEEWLCSVARVRPTLQRSRQVLLL
jgi:hypothetical protein